MISWSLLSNLWQMRGLDYRLVEAQTKYQDTLEKNRQLNQEAEEVLSGKRDEEMVRNYLGLTRANEALVIIPEGWLSSPQSQMSVIRQEQSTNSPNWKKWWSKLFSQ